jgi:hypothetical protein
MLSTYVASRAILEPVQVNRRGCRACSTRYRFESVSSHHGVYRSTPLLLLFLLLLLLSWLKILNLCLCYWQCGYQVVLMMVEWVWWMVQLCWSMVEVEQLLLVAAAPDVVLLFDQALHHPVMRMGCIEQHTLCSNRSMLPSRVGRLVDFGSCVCVCVCVMVVEQVMQFILSSCITLSHSHTHWL